MSGGSFAGLPVAGHDHGIAVYHYEWIPAEWIPDEWIPAVALIAFVWQDCSDWRNDVVVTKSIRTRPGNGIFTMNRGDGHAILHVIDASGRKSVYMAKSTTLGIPPERPVETLQADPLQADHVIDDELLLSLFFLPDSGAALDEVEALAEDDLSRLLIF